MSSLRVASVLTSLHFGGDENRLLHHLRALPPDAAEHFLIVVLGADDDCDAKGGPMRAGYREAGIEVIELDERPFRLRRPLPRPLGGARVGATFARVVARIARILRAREVDVVDARLSLGSLVAAASARAAGGLPVVATNYGVAHWDRPGWRWLGHACFKGTDTVVCDSQARLSEMLSWAHWPPRGAHVPNGIHRPVAQRARAELAAELGWPRDVPVVGQIARLIDYKGQDVLLDAAPAILARAPDAHFLLCGYAQRDDAWRRHLEHRAHELRIADRVRVLSYPGPIGDVWSLVDLHAHPTRRDSSPIAIIEAMSLGLPTVSTDVGGIAELVEDGTTGRVLATADPAALAEEVGALLTDGQRAKAFGAAARARYEARHRPEIMASAMEALYRDAAERWRASRR